MRVKILLRLIKFICSTTDSSTSYHKKLVHVTYNSKTLSQGNGFHGFISSRFVGNACLLSRNRPARASLLSVSHTHTFITSTQKIWVIAVAEAESFYFLKIALACKGLLTTI
jgi:hypothetical protein